MREAKLAHRSGVPNKLPLTELDIRSIARSHSRSMIAVLLSVARQKTAQPSARVAAASIVLDRGFGKVKDQRDENGDTDIKITIRHILEHIDDKPVVVNGEAVRCIEENITVDDDAQLLPSDSDAT